LDSEVGSVFSEIEQRLNSLERIELCFATSDIDG
jgi:hypothetical protein